MIFEMIITFKYKISFVIEIFQMIQRSLELDLTFQTSPQKIIGLHTMLSIILFDFLNVT